jgi:zona occludens toxin (predicted ATPase)
MAKNENIWKFNDDEWKVHIADDDIRQKLADTFGLDRSTIYYENGGLSEETAWDIIVPNKQIEEVKKFLKDNT